MLSTKVEQAVTRAETSPLSDLTEASSSLYAQAVRTYEKVRKVVFDIRGPEPSTPEVINDKPDTVAEACRYNIEQSTQLLRDILAQIERL